MKRISLFLLTILLVLLLTSYSSVRQQVVQLPNQIQVAILAGVTFLLTFAVNGVANRIPWLGKFLGQYILEFSATVAGGVTMWLQSLLNMIPSQWEGVGNAAMVLLVAVLAALHLVTLTGKVRRSLAK